MKEINNADCISIIEMVKDKPTEDKACYSFLHKTWCAIKATVNGRKKKIDLFFPTVALLPVKRQPNIFT